MGSKLAKKRAKSLEGLDLQKRYTVDQAAELVKNKAYAKFDETVDLAVRLGVNPKHADQMVRGAVVMPHGIGKVNRVLVFAKGDKANEATEAGADFVGADDLVAKVTEGWLDFDTVIATPDMMGQVGRLGRVLGPRGLMPNPKVGTVTPDVAGAIRNAKAGQVRYRTDKAGIIHCTISKLDFASDQLRENLQALLHDLQKIKPATSKGVYIRRVTVSTTMGPGLAVDQTTLSF